MRYYAPGHTFFLPIMFYKPYICIHHNPIRKAIPHSNTSDMGMLMTAEINGAEAP